MNEYPYEGGNVRTVDEMVPAGATLTDPPVDVEVAGLPAVALSFQLVDGRSRIVRYIRADDRLVTLVLTYAEGSAEVALDNAEKFFSSFRIQKNPAPSD